MRNFLVSTALALMAGPGLAQSAYPEGLSTYGSIAIAGVGSTGGGDASTFGYGDFGVSYDFGGNFGVDYSLFAIGGESLDLSAHYLALAYNFGDMRVSIGAPRAAFDRYGEFRVAHQNPYFKYVLTQGITSMVTIVDLQGSAYQSYGIRLDGSSNGLDYAVSLHTVDGLADAAAISASARYELGTGVVVTGGLDYFEYGTTKYTKAKLGVSKDFGRFDAAFILAYVDQSGGGTIYELSGSYDVTDKFNVGLGVLGMEGDDPIVTLDASYKIYGGAKAFAAITSEVGSGSSDALYAVGLSYAF